MKPTVQYETKEIHPVMEKGHEKLTKMDLTTYDKKVLVGEDLSSNIEANLVEFPMSRLDAFAWKYEDIIGISPDVITHKLNVDPKYTPIQQKRRKFGIEETK